MGPRPLRDAQQFTLSVLILVVITADDEVVQTTETLTSEHMHIQVGVILLSNIQSSALRWAGDLSRMYAIPCPLTAGLGSGTPLQHKCG